MTYQEQLEIEKLNKEIIDNIAATVKPEDFVDYYLHHNQAETMAEYKIRNVKQLKKILTIFNYDFSKPKPSRFKGEKAARSHESYVAGGKKSADTQQRRWEAKSAEEKDAWSAKQKEAHATERFKAKIKRINEDHWASLSAEEKDLIKKQKSIANRDAWKENKADILNKTKQTCLAKYGVDTYTKTERYKEQISAEENLKQRNVKTYRTKKANNSFNSSKPEESFHKFLAERFGEDDVVPQYRSDGRYPFACDFYIKSKDLFIELNFHWSHGGRRFDANDPSDVAKLDAWRKKALTSKFYANAIKTWTVRDLNKYKAAEENKLNYKAFYTEGDAFACEF